MVLVTAECILLISITIPIFINLTHSCHQFFSRLFHLHQINKMLSDSYAQWGRVNAKYWPAIYHKLLLLSFLGNGEVLNNSTEKKPPLALIHITDKLNGDGWVALVWYSLSMVLVNSREEFAHTIQRKLMLALSSDLDFIQIIQEWRLNWLIACSILIIILIVTYYCNSLVRILSSYSFIFVFLGYKIFIVEGPHQLCGYLNSNLLLFSVCACYREILLSK